MLASQPDGPKGVFAAALTPLDQDHRPDIKAATRHCQWLLANGCDGIGLLGTTGEAPSFPVADRTTLLDGLIAGGVKADQLIVGTGAAALGDAIELTAHAVAHGVAGCLVVPPFYFKNVGDEGLYRSYAELIDGVGRDDFRLYLYHFPQTSAVPIPATVIYRLIDAYPGIVRGIKDSSADLDNLLSLIRTFPDLDVFSGSERLLLPALKAGGAGCIAAGANVTSTAIGALYAHFLAHGGDEDAHAAQAQVTALRDLFDGISMIPAMKALLARHRGAPGWSRVVPPLSPLTEESGAAFFARIDKSDLVLP